MKTNYIPEKETFVLPKELKEKLSKTAYLLNTSKSAILREALEKYLRSFKCTWELGK